MHIALNCSVLRCQCCRVKLSKSVLIVAATWRKPHHFVLSHMLNTLSCRNPSGELFVIYVFINVENSLNHSTSRSRFSSLRGGWIILRSQRREQVRRKTLTPPARFWSNSAQESFAFCSYVLILWKIKQDFPVRQSLFPPLLNLWTRNSWSSVPWKLCLLHCCKLCIWPNTITYTALRRFYMSSAQWVLSTVRDLCKNEHPETMWLGADSLTSARPWWTLSLHSSLSLMLENCGPVSDSERQAVYLTMRKRCLTFVVVQLQNGLELKFCRK